MIAACLPSLTVRALPKGIKVFSSPISPRTPLSFLCIKKITGSGERNAVLIKPFTSQAFDGTATASPAVCANKDSNELQWCAPPSAVPDVARITSGTG